jgi:hypothetical protein
MPPDTRVPAGSFGMSTGLIGGRSLAALMCLALAVGCAPRSVQYRFEVSGDDSADAKIERVKQIITEERLGRLRSEIKARVPGVSDAEMAGLAIGWVKRVRLGESERHLEPAVIVTIVFRYSRGVDPLPVLKAARAILEPEINVEKAG